MGGWRFVVAEGDLDELAVEADPIVVEQAPHAALLEASPVDSLLLQLAGGARVSVFRNAAIARTAFEHFAAN